MTNEEMLSSIVGRKIENIVVNIEDNCIDYDLVDPQNKGEYHIHSINFDRLQTCKTCKWYLNNECMDCRNYVDYEFKKVTELDTCEYYDKIEKE